MQRAGGSRQRVKTVWLQINTFLNKLKKKKKNSWVGKQLAHMHTRPLCKKNNSNDYKYLTRQSDAFFKKNLKGGQFKGPGAQPDAHCLQEGRNQSPKG